MAYDKYQSVASILADFETRLAIGGSVTLNVLSISPTTATIGTAYSGTVTGKTVGSVLSLTGAGAAGLNASGSTVTGTPTTAGVVNIVETLVDATNSPRTSSAALTVSVTVTLGALTLSGTLANGTASSGTINGATAGSSIVSNVAGLTVNSGARTYSFDGSAIAGTTANGLVETLAGATNSPRSSAVVVAAAAAGTSASRYSFSGTRLRVPDGGLGTAATSANQFRAAAIQVSSPDYNVTNPRFYFPAFYNNTNSATFSSVGTEPPMAGGNCTFQSVLILIGGTWYECDSASQAGIATIAPGDPGWLSPKISGVTIPANTTFVMRVIYKLDVGCQFPRASVPIVGVENGFGTSTDTQWTNRAGGTLAGASGSLFYYPMFMVAQGGDGRPAFMILGDSGAGIGADDNTTTVVWGARSAMGGIERALDDNATTKRLAFGQLSASGQYPVNNATYPYGWGSAANWSKKIAAVQAVKDQCGDWPFDQVINAHLGNSLSQASYAALSDGMDTYLDLVKTMWGKPIIQSESTNYGSTSTDNFATTINQTPASGFNFPPTGGTNGIAWLFRADVSGNAEPPSASARLRSTGRIVDSFQFWRGTSVDPTGNDRDLKTVKSFTTTFASAYVSGTTLSLTAAPALGEAIRWITDGSTIAVGNVIAITGTGPYTVTMGGTNYGATASGVSVRAVHHVVNDTHPSPLSHRDAYTPIVVAWKVRAGYGL